ncbi:MAG: efflux transporter outer membrane subunit [Betaproteobacteria bacterium]|nr:efflux transporter outer membrane subunit [Betaproteobacteria bacterium]
MKGLRAAAFAAVLLSGCSLIPDYSRPDVPMTPAFKEEGPWHVAHPADQAPRGEWWTVFHDPLLDGMEKQLETGSFELAAALARYDAANAYFSEQNARLYPEIDAVGNLQTNRESVNRPLRGPSLPNVYGNTALGVGTLYEIDLWGHIRSAVTSAEALAEASRQDVESVRLSLQAQLAADYFQLRGFDSQIQLYADSIKAYQSELQLMQRRHDEGIVSGLDVARSQTLLEETEALKFKAMSQRALYEHAIAALLGQSPSAFSIAPKPLVSVYPEVPATIPSQVLQRRPDIAAAERRVVAANANVGVARAAFFPEISLGALGGFQNTGNGALLTAPNSFWTLGPLAFFNIFDAGLREAAVKQAMAQTGEAAANYRNTVLTAFKEVEDNLSKLHYLSEQHAHQLAAVAAARHTYDIATNRYREGVVSYLEVIDAENAKLRTERVELDVRTARVEASVGLIRAIGGAW